MKCVPGGPEWHVNWERAEEYHAKYPNGLARACVRMINTGHPASFELANETVVSLLAATAIRNHNSTGRNHYLLSEIRSRVLYPRRSAARSQAGKSLTLP